MHANIFMLPHDPFAHLSSVTVRSLPLSLLPSSSYDALLQEKEDLEEAFEAFRQEVTLTRQGNASKELRILKKVIKNLEVCSHTVLWQCVCSSLVPRHIMVGESTH